MLIFCRSVGGAINDFGFEMPGGELPRPQYVVFADTGSEMPHTYATVERIKDMCIEGSLPFETVRYETPLHEKYLKDNSVPLVGIRSCTSRWKIDPIKRFMRSIVGNGRGKVIANVWLGISTDERRRATPSKNKWTARCYPLLELNMSRNDCNHYLGKNGFGEVKKSGCFMCPYQSAKQWAKLKKNHPELFDVSLEMEKRAIEVRGFRGGLWHSDRSIQAFNSSHTLVDFGLEMKCDPGGSCFL